MQVALLEWISMPYIVAGLVAWWRRPDSRLGVLMIAGGFATGPLRARVRAASPLPHTIGVVFDVLPAVLFLHVFLAFPDGRLRSRFERVLVAAGYAAAVGLQLVKMALGGVGPQNLLEIAAQPTTARTVEQVQLLVDQRVVPGRHRRPRLRGGARPGRPLRRPVALLIDSFALGLVMIAVLFVVRRVRGAARSRRSSARR